jgi:hypothetical protein
MPRALNLKGKRFEYFVVVDQVGKDKHGQLRWLCKCNCGNQFESTSQAISKEQRRSCGCQAYSKTRRVKRIKDPKDISYKRAVNRRKQQAKKRGIEWHLSDNQTKELLLGNCFYCGTPPFTSYNAYLTKSGTYCGVRHQGYADECWITVNGIDRIDSSKHYTIDNVVSCCKICNAAKNIMTQKQFWQWIEKVYHHGKNMRN